MKRIPSGAFFPAIDTGDSEECRSIPRNEQDRLAILASQGDIDAKQKLVKSCMKFAINRASKYYRMNPDIPFTDFVQEACLGLLQAAEKVDLSRGRFLTCAGPYVDKNLKLLYFDHRYIVRIPIHARWDRNRKRGKSVTDAVAIVKNEQKHIDECDISSEDVERDLDKEELLKQLRYILTELDQFERAVIEVRYLSSAYVVPLREVAQRLRTNKGRVELAEIRAMERLKQIVKEREIA